jgi:membrane-bound ClpP family serine protease
LETDGGYIQVVERIVRVFRNYYGRVEFVVPNYAMSAGTVLAMSGDAIHMDYYSVLGPIDPQLPKPNGPGMVPALGYLAEYNRLVKKSAAGGLTSAEVAYFIEKFDPGEMHDFKQARALSVTLLTNWLVQYKFKDWAETETNKTPVTQEIKEERAKSIAKALNKTTLWHSHGRGIPMVVLEDKLKLKIDDLAENPERYKCVEKYSNLLKHYMVKSGNEFALHTPGRYSCF